MDDMKKKVKTKELELTIPILPNIELLVGKVVSELARYMKLDQNEEDEVKMATIEACLNAFEHSKSKDGKVYLKFQIANDELMVVVRDSGVGFNSEELNPPPIEEMLSGKRKRGWGLKIIENLVDSVEIHSEKGKGTTVIIRKRKKG